MSSEEATSPTTGSVDARGRMASSARVGMFTHPSTCWRGPEGPELEQAIGATDLTCT